VQAQLKLILIVISFTCTNFTAFAQEDKLTIPSPVSIEQQHKADISHYFPTNRVAPILAGPDDYLTLVNENTSVNNKGVAILLPDWQQGAVNPKALNFLRTALPKQGWTTISIQPANKPSNFPSTALKISEQQQANKKIIDAYKTKLSALINAVVTKSKDYPGIVIIIAQGNHGAMLVDIFEQQSSKPNSTTPNALILLSSYLLNSNELIDETNTNFAKALAYSEYPVLDLYLKYDNKLLILAWPWLNAVLLYLAQWHYRILGINLRRGIRYRLMLWQN
jgi:hypothetical protein